VALDDAAGAKPSPWAFLAENHVTGIKRSNGTQTPKNGSIDSAEAPRKGQSRKRGVVLLIFNDFIPLNIEMVNFEDIF
jgi:hypothetical protein